MATITLQGRVTNTDGIGRAEVAVTIRRAPADVPDLSALTDGSGRFTLHHLPPGDYELYFMPPDGAGRSYPVHLRDSEVRQTFVVGD